jgi:hypothetical protein
MVVRQYPGERPEPPEQIGRPRRDPDGSFPLVENMGDAVEAMEECYGMVWALAERLARAELGGDAPREALLSYIADAQQRYADGYRLGAGEDPSW